MPRIIRVVMMSLLIAATALCAAGCTFSKNGDKKGSIYNSPPSDSSTDSNGSSGPNR